MKFTLYILLLTTLSCNNQHQQVEPETPAGTSGNIIPTEKKDNANKAKGSPKYHTSKDPLIIVAETVDSFEFSKEEFNNIVDNHPELTTDYIESPDETFNSYAGEQFGSEAGQDTYYVLYGYFLQQKNGTGKYAALRKKLVNIYAGLNALFRNFRDGGTFFGHQYLRIMGYAEYSVYLYAQNEKNISKGYDITKEKGLYIKSLRQLIKDENKTDFSRPEQEKIRLKKESNEIVSDIEKEITDSFCLKRAQEFQLEHYEYK